MATVKKTIGKVPVWIEEYKSGSTYSKFNIVGMYGSSYISLIDNNTTPPATIGEDDNIIVDTEKWGIIADASKYYTFVDKKQDKLTAGKGIEINGENVISVTLDTDVFFVAEVLPESPTDEQKRKICLVPSTETESGNEYTEYVWVVNDEHPSGYWEEMGKFRAAIDLTPYQKKNDDGLQTQSKEVVGAINEVKQTADSAQPATDETLETDSKEIVGAINEVNAAEKSLTEALGYKGTVTPIDVPISQDGKYRIAGGDTYSNPSYAIRSPFSIKKGQMIYGYKGGPGVAFSISKIDNNGKWLDFMLNTFNLTDIVWVAPCDMTIEISSEKSFFSNLRLATLDSFAALQDNGFALGMRKIYESYGAVYNETTGYYELNGLTDLTDSDMLEIIKVGNVLRFSSSINDTDQIIINASSLKVRTLLPNQFIYYFSNRRYSIFNAFRESSKIEVIILGTQDYPLVSSGHSSTAFYNCSKLRELKYLKLGTLNTSIFGNCTALNKCFITTEGDISFSSSPLLSYESLNYLVTNAANTDAITVTVHPTTYSYLLGAEPTEEVGGTTEEWQALVATAQEKQISFATA